MYIDAPEKETTFLPPSTTIPHNAPLPAGPALGPTMPPAGDSQDQEDVVLSAPGSPYTSSRAAIRNLTMPSHPKFDIPPSPPGSPPPGSTKKFAKFLELKKKGIHFNERLERTTALKNPSLYQTLKDRAGISDEEQYATTLSENLAVPTKFPPWAYADELYRSQQKILKKREEEAKKKPREAIDFVPATSSATSSRANTPGGLRSGTKSTAEKVLGGLEKTKPGAVQLIKRKR